VPISIGFFKGKLYKESIMSHVMSASVHHASKEWSEEGFARGMAGYSVLLASMFAGATVLGHSWLHPTWFTVAACLVMALICLYSKYQEGKPSSTLAGVLGTMIFFGLTLGSATALLNWMEAFVVIMITMVIIATVSFVAFCFSDLFRDRLSVVGMVIAALLLSFMFWEFASELSRSLFGIGTVQISLSSWVGIIIYVCLTAGIWRTTLEEGFSRDHDNAIRTAADAVFIFAGIFLAIVSLGQLVWRQLSPKGDDD
jgi:hypothetical protein